MGHLLMVESWVGAMSALLPRGIRESGHRFSFITRDLHHYLRSSPVPGAHPLLGAENLLTTETNDVAALAEHVARLQPVLGFDGVLTSCDYYLPAVAHIAARLGLPGAPPEAVERACSKDLTRRALREAGVPGPAFALAESAAGLEEAAAALGYPLVLKPVDLCAGMFVRKVTDDVELRDAYAALRQFPVNARGQRRNPLVLLEELLTGPEVSVETVTSRGRTSVIGVTDKSIAGAPWFVETGHMFPAALDLDTERAVVETAVAAVEALGLDNVVGHTELKLTPDGPRIVEVNPRPAGNQITELVRRVTGIDLAAAYAQVALGEEPALERAETGAGSAAISFLLPPKEGVIGEVVGVQDLDGADGVVDWKFKSSGHRSGPATSNNNYLGHVMVTAPDPGRARAKAEALVGGLDVRYAEEVPA
ncbi:argininosuccinate lyase [Saccharopolyspora erythraea NRRL 2338]|uniref:Fusion protein (ligase/carboxylase and argininosuccinate lyase) n=2 Tax=Saccharopolyspora erythraea TaxID=1836 RepID=A4FN76_SACEN|nr:ATP-grasp domain-containing protein [Saccharopolyspora erythraea]EQD84466.1 carboxylate--amine ligase [Saccharopolyspora erythraea D]PFG99142.1 argininosuccinate lyase [Saccharopolyspora erythraea NRRL 2338]QRK89096.1 ATP-grasp domain-containing protein [Saccharopolyspora erythraea]CAM05501.1 putative fusion protein (ligase/carboxylase and argininosuccinate lyase [Saccharopolyspora erythraea NRRL 2338]